MAMSTAGVLLFGLLAPALTFAQTRKPLPLNSREFWTIIKTALTAPDGYSTVRGTGCAACRLDCCNIRRQDTGSEFEGVPVAFTENPSC
jgi:hypothetical protein